MTNALRNRVGVRPASALLAASGMLLASILHAGCNSADKPPPLPQAAPRAATAAASNHAAAADSKAAPSAPTTAPASSAAPAVAVADPNYPGQAATQTKLCEVMATPQLAQECRDANSANPAQYVYNASFRSARAATLATDLHRRFGLVTRTERDHMMNGGYRGTIHIVPEWPTTKELEFVTTSFTHFEEFERDLRARAGKSGGFPRYRVRNLDVRFFRSEKRTTPSAYAAAWYVAYNLAGSLMGGAASVEETLFHELFHANDEAHRGFTNHELELTHQAIKRRCGTAIACLTPFAPGSTLVRGGTYYAFQPGNGVEEYGAELAIRYYLEQSAALKGTLLSKPLFKCGPAENAQSWGKLVHEMFDDIDITPACK